MPSRPLYLIFVSVVLVTILAITISVRAQSSISHPIPPSDYAIEDVSQRTTWLTRPSIPQGDGTWTFSSATNAPLSTYGSIAIWTGREMIVWGGQNNSGAHNIGGRYNPATDTWGAISTSNAPEPRFGHVAVWTGKEMLIWGSIGSGINSGGRYNPLTNQWLPISSTNAPPAQNMGHKAVWTGHEMMVWGVSSSQGALYDPVLDQWTTITTTGAPLAISPGYSPPALAMVWTGEEVIAFYSLSETAQKSGGRYDPETDTWRSISLVNAPLVEYKAAVTWTGQEMIVYGGVDIDGAPGPNLGARYNPTSDTWLSIPSNPMLQGTTIGLWNGAEVLLLGVGGYELTGARYDPATNAWLDLPRLACAEAIVPFGNAVWSGTEILTWGAEGCIPVAYGSTPALRFTVPYRTARLFSVDADTYIAQGYPSESFENEPVMFNGYDPQYGYLTERMLLQFPIGVPTRANVEQATAYLYMYAYNNGAAPMNISAHRAIGSWNENSTWQASANNFDSTPSSVVSVGTAFGWYGWDVTATVRRWLSGTPNYGLMFNGNAAGNRNERVFLAREAGGNTIPFMTVTYTDPAYAADSTPPMASLSGLPPVQDYRTPILVEWGGSDQGRGIHNFDVQVLDDSTGVWSDWYSWAVGRSADFTGIAGRIYCFRVRARDYAGNVGDWSTDNRCTTFYAYAVTGVIVDHRHTPVTDAVLQVQPAALTVTLNVLNGQYTLYFADDQPRQIMAMQPAYAAPPVANIVITATDHYDFVMQPIDNIVLNSNVESGLASWAVSGTLPVSTTDFSHSGNLALALNSEFTPTAGDASIEQALAIPATDAPQILSFMYNLTATALLSDSQLVVTVATTNTESTVWNTQTACIPWCHAWIDVSAWRGQVVTLTMDLTQQSGETLQATLDEIVLGSWQTPIIEQVAPARVDAHVSTVITLTGQNFLAEPLSSNYITGPIVLLNTTPIETHWIATNTLSATVPATMPFGLYTLWVKNPDGFDGVLPAGLRVGYASILPIIAKNY